MKRLLVVLLLIATPIVAVADDANVRVAPWKRIALYTGLAVATYSDARSSRYVASDRNNSGAFASEIFFTDRIIPHRNAWYGFKFSISVYAVLTAERDYRKGNRYWWVAPAIGTAENGLAGLSNYRQIRIHDPDFKFDRKVLFP